MGAIIIEWPAPRGPLIPSLITITDAATGKQIKTCSRMVICCDVDELVTADLTLFADEDGKPIYDGKPIAGDDEILTGVFSFEVTEMRVRSKPFSEHAAEVLTAVASET